MIGRLTPFAGRCPFHGDCWEGMVAGPAIEARWGQKAETLPSDHPAWALEAHYLALGLVNIITILSPQRIIMGGGVMAPGTIIAIGTTKCVTATQRLYSIPCYFR